MAEIKLGLDEAVLRELTGEAILRAIDSGARESLIKQALEFLLTKAPSGYSGGPRHSPLEDAFCLAVKEVARKIVNDKLVDDPTINEEVRQLVQQAWNQLRAREGEGREKLVNKIADAISSTLIPRSY